MSDADRIWDMDRVWDMIQADAEQFGQATISRHILKEMYSERAKLQKELSTARLSEIRASADNNRLRAKCNRLQRYIETVEVAIPIVNWQKHKAALLHDGDVDPEPDATEEE